jgi:hypothetical protein
MSGAPVGRRNGSGFYEIRLKGHLDPRWAVWFDGMSVSNDGDGTTALRGAVVDQAALHGLLQKVRDTGLPLVSLTSLGTAAQLTAAALPNSSPKEAT